MEPNACEVRPPQLNVSYIWKPLRERTKFLCKFRIQSRSA